MHTPAQSTNPQLTIILSSLNLMSETIERFLKLRELCNDPLCPRLIPELEDSTIKLAKSLARDITALHLHHTQSSNFHIINQCITTFIELVAKEIGRLPIQQPKLEIERTSILQEQTPNTSEGSPANVLSETAINKAFTKAIQDLNNIAPSQSLKGTTDFDFFKRTAPNPPPSREEATSAPEAAPSTSPPRKPLPPIPPDALQ